MELRNSIWNGMLDADMNARYWGHLALKYRACRNGVWLFLLCTAAGAAACWGQEARYAWLWYTLLGVSALVLFVYLVTGIDTRARTLTRLVRAWREIKTAYDLLWRSINSADPDMAMALDEYGRVRALETDASALDAGLPARETVLETCYVDVLRARQITEGTEFFLACCAEHARNGMHTQERT